MIKAFKSYDIRGIYGIDFDGEDVYRIGFFLPRLLNADKVMVSRDMRLSSPQIHDLLVAGITDSGADVYDIGLATTPMNYYITAKEHFAAAVQITASHNPKEHNGLKVSTNNAAPIGYQNGLQQLEYMIENETVIPAQKKGKVIQMNVQTEYVQFLSAYCEDISNLNIVMDCSNGMAGLLVEKIFHSMPQYLNLMPDGNFPSHAPNPLELENIVQLQQSVRQNGADIGVIFDGDADRVMFIDENANFISPDLIIAFLAQHFLKSDTINRKVLVDIRTSLGVIESLKEMNAEVFMWKVGRANAAVKLREIDGLFGGELAGHYYFKDFYYSDSGILAAILVLNLLAKLKKQNSTFSKAIAQYIRYANSGEINFQIENKSLAMETLKNHFCHLQPPVNIYDFDGYRIEFNDWWMNIRASNTESYLRFIAEAKTKSLLNEKIKEVEKILQTIQ
ncbi:MAG: phosphomannomutase/phosphoglucomutase [Bacteroidales bacterium]|jgi:phosphomannomutase|nr:phosphomannomutase/phosphoglucomutase [Bacteroidales bacterium]